MFPTLDSPRSGPGRWAAAALCALVVLAAAAGTAPATPAPSAPAVTPAGAPASTPVADCRTLSVPGVYELDRGLTAGEGACLRITASDVTLRGNGHTIDATAAASAAPVMAAGGDGTLSNVTVTGLRIETAPRPAVRFDGVRGGAVAGVTVRLADPSAPGGEVAVAGDDNRVRAVSGGRLVVTGDDNRVADSTALGTDYAGVTVRGDDNSFVNVTSQGRPALVLDGDDNRVAGGSYEGVAAGDAVVVSGAGDAVTNATLSADDDGAGVRLDGTTNATVAGNRFAGDLGTGLAAADSDGALVAGNRFGADLLFGVRLANASDGTLRRNVLRAPLLVGDRAGGNLVYDNRFDAGRDVFDRNVLFGSPADPDGGDPAPNAWNVTPRPGENVVGGDTVAGNYYAGPDDSGFSETCTDADADGLCDAAYELAPTNTDRAPLAPPVDDDAGPGGADDGEAGTPGAERYQVDFVAGEPIENLSADRLYAGQDRLLRFAFGNESAGVTERGSAWPNERIRECVDYGHVVEHGNGTASVSFTVADGCANVTLSLVTYSLPGEEFDVDTVSQQELLTVTTGTYEPGTHTIAVRLPGTADGADG